MGCLTWIRRKRVVLTTAYHRLPQPLCFDTGSFCSQESLLLLYLLLKRKAVQPLCLPLALFLHYLLVPFYFALTCSTDDMIFRIRCYRGSKEGLLNSLLPLLRQSCQPFGLAVLRCPHSDLSASFYPLNSPRGPMGSQRISFFSAQKTPSTKQQRSRSLPFSCN